MNMIAVIKETRYYHVEVEGTDYQDCIDAALDLFGDIGGELDPEFSNYEFDGEAPFDGRDTDSSSDST